MYKHVQTCSFLESFMLHTIHAHWCASEVAPYDAGFNEHSLFSRSTIGHIVEHAVWLITHEH